VPVQQTEQMKKPIAVKNVAQPVGEQVPEKKMKWWIWLVIALVVIGVGIGIYYLFF